MCACMRVVEAWDNERVSHSSRGSAPRCPPRTVHPPQPSSSDPSPSSPSLPTSPACARHAESRPSRGFMLLNSVPSAHSFVCKGWVCIALVGLIVLCTPHSGKHRVKRRGLGVGSGLTSAKHIMRDVLPLTFSLTPGRGSFENDGKRQRMPTMPTQYTSYLPGWSRASEPVVRSSQKCLDFRLKHAKRKQQIVCKGSALQDGEHRLRAPTARHFERSFLLPVAGGCAPFLAGFSSQGGHK